MQRSKIKLLHLTFDIFETDYSCGNVVLNFDPLNKLIIFVYQLIMDDLVISPFSNNAVDYVDTQRCLFIIGRKNPMLCTHSFSTKFKAKEATSILQWFDSAINGEFLRPPTTQCNEDFECVEASFDNFVANLCLIAGIFCVLNGFKKIRAQSFILDNLIKLLFATPFKSQTTELVYEKLRIVYNNYYKLDYSVGEQAEILINNYFTTRELKSMLLNGFSITLLNQINIVDVFTIQEDTEINFGSDDELDCESHKMKIILQYQESPSVDFHDIQITSQYEQFQKKFQADLKPIKSLNSEENSEYCKDKISNSNDHKPPLIQTTLKLEKRRAFEDFVVADNPLVDEIGMFMKRFKKPKIVKQHYDTPRTKIKRLHKKICCAVTDEEETNYKEDN